jgi:hypothetical protein
MKQLARPKQVVVHDTTVREGFQRKERLIPPAPNCGSWSN